MGGPRDEGAVRPEPAVGHEQMQVRMPVRPGSVRLQARHDAHGEVAHPAHRYPLSSDGAVEVAEDVLELLGTLRIGAA